MMRREENGEKKDEQVQEQGKMRERASEIKREGKHEEELCTL